MAEQIFKMNETNKISPVFGEYREWEFNIIVVNFSAISISNKSKYMVNLYEKQKFYCSFICF